MITPFPEAEGDPRRPSGARPRVLLYSGDVLGLAHLHRTHLVASELARRRPDAAILLLVASPQFHAFEPAANVDYVKIPSTRKEHVYLGLPGGDPQRGGLSRMREAIIRATVAAFAPQLVYVDDDPVGHNGELRAALESLRAAQPETRFVVELRDVINTPEATRRYWQALGCYRWLDEVYDRILICGQPEIFDQVREYHFSAAAAAKTVYCGYTLTDEPIAPPQEIRARLGTHDESPLVIVTPGGGEDGAGLIDSYLAAARTGLLDGITSFVVTGPLAAEPTHYRDAARALPGMTVVAFQRDIYSYFNAADLVITRAGTTLSDVAALGRRSLAVPTKSEQIERAERFARLGLTAILPAREVTPERLARAVRERLAAPEPPRLVDSQALTRIGDELERLLDHAP